MPYFICCFFLLLGIPSFSESITLSPATLEGLLELDPAVPGFHAVPFRESMEANAILPTPPLFFENRGIMIAEELFERFCNRSIASVANIPKSIHMIWLGSPPTPFVKFAIASWKKHHPLWDLKLWTDEQIKELTWSHPKSEFLFKNAKNWAEKSDILRFEILYQYGGVYADTDAVCLKPLDSLIESGLSFFACFEENKIQHLGCSLIGSAVIIAAQNHPIFHRCLDYSSSEAENPKAKQYIRSGPGPLTQACYEALEAGHQDLLILPCTYFYPLPWIGRFGNFKQISKNVRPESFTVHLWEGSWAEIPKG